MIHTLINSILRDTKITEQVGASYKYSSTQVDAPVEVAEKVLAFSLAIPEDEIYRDPEDPSLGRELGPHITIKYGLETTNPEDVEKLAKESKVGEIDIVLKEISLFESDDTPYDVVKIDVQSPNLHELNKLFSTLPNADTHPEYKPHLTVAYVKKGIGKKYEGVEEFVGVNFKSDCFYFKSSTGDSKKIDLASQVEETTLQKFLSEKEPVGKETEEIIKGANPVAGFVPWQ
jgi:2'-5' RNA ligase